MQAFTPLARLNKTARAALGMRSALAAILAVGCVAVPGFALAGTLAQSIPGNPATASKKVEKAVAGAERAVAKQPQSAEARARLGQVYLAAGRFVSASTSFEDAVALGDKSPASALGMALSYIGANRNAEAVALLGQWRDSIPAGDYALALALAGDPAQAVAVLGEQIKQGDNTPKNRQNLAYAYALGGHLAEARVIASHDVPIDQLDARVSDWALQASVGSQQSRVAALLGAPVRSDPGQPTQLALSGAPERAQMAVNTPAPPPAPAAEELPALAGGAVPMQAEAQVSPTPAQPEPAALAEVEPAPTTPVLAEAPGTGLRFVSNPVVQAIAASDPVPAQRTVRRAPARALAAKSPVAAPRQASAPTPAPAPAPTHLVQLGSFTTEEGARRAWGIFQRRDPSLKDHELHLTQAVVHGRNYWRVAAAGYDMASARAKCSTTRGGGQGCLAYASGRALPGAIAVVAQRLAQR